MEALEIAKELLPFISIVKPITTCVLNLESKEIKYYIESKKLNKKMFDPKYCEIVFENYISRTWDKCSVINTLIFPNQQILIDRLYHPLSIIDDNEEIKIDSFPIKLFDKYKRILICDNAGMGKSTMSKFICIQAIKNNIGIPIFIELKNLNSENTILKEFSNQLTSIDKVYDEEFVLRL